MLVAPRLRVGMTSSLLAAVVVLMSVLMPPAQAKTSQNEARPILLAEGRSGRYQWAASVVGGRGKTGDQRPCLVDQIIDRKAATDPNSFEQQHSLKVCGPLAAATAPPQSVSVAMGEGPQMLTAYVIATVPAIATVVLDFDAGGVRTFHLKSLNSAQRAKAGVRSMHYVGVAVKGDSCLRQVTARNANGNVVFEGPTGTCP
jgi:hypothetical protein